VSGVRVGVVVTQYVPLRGIRVDQGYSVLKLNGMAAIVTGAASRLGQSTASALAAHGVRCRSRQDSSIRRCSAWGHVTAEIRTAAAASVTHRQSQ